MFAGVGLADNHDRAHSPYAVLFSSLLIFKITVNSPFHYCLWQIQRSLECVILVQFLWHQTDYKMTCSSGGDPTKSHVTLSQATNENAKGKLSQKIKEMNIRLLLTSKCLEVFLFPIIFLLWYSFPFDQWVKVAGWRVWRCCERIAPLLLCQTSLVFSSPTMMRQGFVTELTSLYR